MSWLLFNESDLRSLIDHTLREAREYVDRIEENKFLASSDDELLEHIVSQFHVEPLELHEDAKQMDTQETKIDARNYPDRYASDPSRPFYIPGVEIKVLIPYSGNPELWRCQPSTFDFNPPHANVIINGINGDGNFLEIVLQSPSDNANEEQFKYGLDSTLSKIKKYIGYQRGDIDNYNETLRIQINDLIQKRRQRLGKHAEIAKALNIPLVKKPGSPDFSKLPIKRKIVKPLPAAPNKPSEPGIDDEIYNYILEIIRHEGRTFETAPQTFSVHDEEGLRDILLAHLNGHLKGEATGETFRKNGKTDIRIEDQNRAAFVAECKVWRGPQELTNALDQLFGYLTWRDCKAALILFNKEVSGFSAIQNKAPEVLKKHPNFIKQESTSHQGEWRFLFRSTEDAERHIRINVFLFNLYTVSK